MKTIRSVKFYYKQLKEYDSLPETSDFETLNKYWGIVERAAAVALPEICTILIKHDLMDEKYNLTEKGKKVFYLL